MCEAMKRFQAECESKGMKEGIDSEKVNSIISMLEFGITKEQILTRYTKEDLERAEILFYPTAIGSEPILEVDSMPHWRRCMQGHSACNIIPVVAANRIGEEKVTPSEANGYQESSLVFYGSSFVTDATGEIVTQASRDKEEIVYGESDLDADADLRVSWGLFRDRRPEIYKSIR